MSNFLWNAQSVAYVLKEFDGGRSAAQIHNEFLHAGYNVLVGTVEQTLRVNGRNVDGVDPLARPNYISNSYGTPGNRGPAYNQPGNQVTHQHLVRNDNYPGTWGAQGNLGARPSLTPGNFAPQSSHGRHWDSQADSFAIQAHRSGQSVLQIWSDLRGRGYVVNAAEVAGSLNSQGVSGVHVADYLSRWASNFIGGLFFRLQSLFLLPSPTLRWIKQLPACLVLKSWRLSFATFRTLENTRSL